jgi:hypothetical protein
MVEIKKKHVNASSRSLASPHSPFWSHDRCGKIKKKELKQNAIDPFVPPVHLVM